RHRNRRSGTPGRRRQHPRRAPPGADPRPPQRRPRRDNAVARPSVMTIARTRIRSALTSGRRLVGTFVKLPSLDVIELCEAAGFDFVVVDLEHSTLTESDAITLVRHA